MQKFIDGVIIFFHKSIKGMNIASIIIVYESWSTSYLRNPLGNPLVGRTLRPKGFLEPSVFVSLHYLTTVTHFR